MKMYKDIYAFQAIDEIKNGNDVYVVDKAGKDIYHLNNMTAEEFVFIVNSDNSNNRFLFYVIEEAEETNE